MHYQLCYSAKEGEILATLGSFSSPKSLALGLIAALALLSCAPPSPRPAELLRPCAERGAAPLLAPLVDESTPSGLESLLHGARLGSPAVDADAATLVAILEPQRWEALTESARTAWLARVERVGSSDSTSVALRFHFVRDGARWLLDLRARSDSR